MKTFKPFIYANLYLFAPGAIIFLNAPMFGLVFKPIFNRFATTLFPVCDYTAGGGSINLCNNNIWISTWFSALLIATLIAYIATRRVIRRLDIHWRSPLYGLALFYITPIILYLINSFLTDGTYGNQRGAINTVFVNTLIIFLPILFLIFAYFNFTSYSKTLDQ